MMEYTTQFVPVTQGAKLHEELNNFAAEGWELHTVLERGANFVLILQREVVEKEIE